MNHYGRLGVKYFAVFIHWLSYTLVLAVLHDGDYKKMSIGHNVRLKYTGALLAMAVLLTIAMLLIQFLLRQQSTDANVINIAGMQRMLSQRIALFSSEPNKVQHPELMAALVKFESNHQFLTQSTAGDYPYLNAQLRQLYFAPPINLEQRSEQFIRSTREFLDDSNTELAQAIRAQSQQLLPDLNRAVSLFEQHAEDKTEQVRSLQISLWLLGLLLLAFEAWFIFRPMRQQIEATLTGLEESRELADAALKAKSRFLSRVSHELRTPLQAVQGYLDAYWQEKDERHLQHVRDASQQLDNLLYSIEDFNHLSMQEIVPERQEVELGAELKVACAAYRLSAHQKSLAFNMAISKTLYIRCYCDHKRINWLLNELITNAIKFTEQGKIQVVADLIYIEQQPMLEIIIDDSGPGFDYSSLQEAGESDHFQGSQLGLKRCRLLVSSLGGSLRFSKIKPTGTRALLLMPLELCDESNAPTSAPLTTSLRVLLVEDNVLNAKVIESMLQPLAQSIQHVEHGAQALDVYNSDAFDLVLMDLNMPVMDGFEATERLRERDPQVPILVVTANTNLADIERAYQVGATAHVFKPLQPDDLINKIAALVNQVA
ncbi:MULTISPECIES: response regulator [unclassified Pseudoalteromonas]|uniref:response regulator n=1 Tax=unclassified Pseudoalteromonas TaxID=194690 RepID=UPI003014E699